MPPPPPPASAHTLQPLRVLGAQLRVDDLEVGDRVDAVLDLWGGITGLLLWVDGGVIVVDAVLMVLLDGFLALRHAPPRCAAQTD